MGDLHWRPKFERHGMLLIPDTKVWEVFMNYNNCKTHRQLYYIIKIPHETLQHFFEKIILWRLHYFILFFQNITDDTSYYSLYITPKELILLYNTGLF